MEGIKGSEDQRMAQYYLLGKSGTVLARVIWSGTSRKFQIYSSRNGVFDWYDSSDGGISDWYVVDESIVPDLMEKVRNK